MEGLVALFSTLSTSLFSSAKISLTFRSLAAKNRRRPGFPLRRASNSPGEESAVPFREKERCPYSSWLLTIVVASVAEVKCTSFCSVRKQGGISLWEMLSGI